MYSKYNNNIPEERTLKHGLPESDEDTIEKMVQLAQKASVVLDASDTSITHQLLIFIVVMSMTFEPNPLTNIIVFSNEPKQYSLPNTVYSQLFPSNFSCISI